MLILYTVDTCMLFAGGGPEQQLISTANDSILGCAFDGFYYLAVGTKITSGKIFYSFNVPCCFLRHTEQDIFAVKTRLV